MSYKKVGWEDSPSSNTPILSVSLNQMDDGIEKANKGIVFSYSATFTADNVLKYTTSTEALGAGSFATSQTDIVTVFVADNVTKIDSGAFANCTSLKTIYIDNTVGNVEIVSGAVPDGVSIVYSNDDNFINVNELLVSAIKSLKTKIATDEEQHKADTATLSQAIQSVKESAIEEITVVKYTVSDLDKNKVNNTDFNNYKTTNDTAVAKNAADIAQNATNIAQNATDIAQNATDIAQLNNSKANLVQSYNIFDWSVLNGKTANGLTCTIVNGEYQISGTPNYKFASLYQTTLSLDNGDYYIGNNKMISNILYAQVTLTYKDGSKNYFINKDFIVDDDVTKVELSVQAGATIQAIDMIFRPFLCKKADKNKAFLPHKIAQGVSELFPLFNNIKVTTDKSTSTVINNSSDSNIVDLKLSDNSAKVYLYGKNLAEFNSYFAKANGWTTVGTGSASDMVINKDTKNKTVTFNSVNESGRSGINVMWKNSSVDYERLLTKTITISVDIVTTDDCTFFLCNSCDNYKSTTVKLKANRKQRVSVTTTMPSDISKIQNTSILFHIDSTKTNVTLSNFQIELNNTMTSYENYKEKQIISGNTDLSTVHTNYQTTTVIADSDCQLTYIADTKLYIDNKFNELAQVIVASASSEEVM